MSTMYPSLVGSSGAKAARRTPRIRFTISVAADRRAPVEPADTTASPSPSRSKDSATVKEESFFSRNAVAGLSSMVITC